MNKKQEPITMRVRDLIPLLFEHDPDDFVQIITSKGNIKQLVAVNKAKAGIVYLESRSYE